jgi:predicted nicotinamide N-methyase
MRYDTKLEKVTVGSAPGFHQELSIEVIADFNRAIDDMFAELQARGEQDLLTDLCPYFGTVWDSARALSNVLAAKPAGFFTGSSFLEIGCGLAIPSMVAMIRGAASVVATDIHPDVPAFLERNLRANGLEGRPGFQYMPVDWRRDAGLVLAAPVTCILGSDILYDRGQAGAVAAFLGMAFARRGSGRGAERAIITDPGRPYLQDFESACKGVGLSVNVEIFRIDPADKKRDVFVLGIE